MSKDTQLRLHPILPQQFNRLLVALNLNLLMPLVPLALSRLAAILHRLREHEKLLARQATTPEEARRYKHRKKPM